MTAERVLAVVACGIALLALGSGMRGEPDAPPASLAPVEARIHALEGALEKQQRRADRLESEVADAVERIQELRGALASGSIPNMVFPDAGAARRVETPPEQGLVTPDGGPSALLEAAVRSVFEDEMRRREQERAARRSGAAAQWLDNVKAKVGLDDTQVARIRELLEQEQAGRADGGRVRLEEQLRAVFTPEQQKAYDGMERRERRFPRGGPP